jgi:hypothetical protein
VLSLRFGFLDKIPLLTNALVEEVGGGLACTAAVASCTETCCGGGLAKPKRAKCG